MKATQAELARLLASAPFAPDYGFRIAAVADGQCTIEVPFRPSFERPGGVVSGPVFMAAADAAMWMAILARLGVDDPCVTVELNTAFLAAARREGFHCTARVLRWGRRLVYGTAECVAAGDRLLSHHTLTYLRPDGATPPSEGAGGDPSRS